MRNVLQLAMATTSAERMRKTRANRKAADLAEVRNIIAPLDRHAELKAKCAKWLKGRAK